MRAFLRVALSCLIGASWVGAAMGQQPTASQIQQIRAMSPEQRSSLASQLGIAIPVAPALPASEAPTSSTMSQDELFPRRDDRTLIKADEQDPPNPVIKSAGFNDLSFFGYSIFKSKPTTFSPVGAIPVPELYIIGPGDLFRITFFGKQAGESLVRVERDGAITLPDVGQLNVQGLSFEKAKELIERQVSERKLGVTALVTLDTLKSIQVFIVGEVSQPGSFAVGALSTVTNALFVAGGVTERGSLRRIELKRQGRTVSTLDLYDLLLRGDISGDQRLQQGDVIFVPGVGERIGVSGEVKRPSIFEIEAGETLLDVLGFASGFSGFAFEREIRVSRTESGVQRILRTLDAGGLGQLIPQEGDLVEVLPVDVDLVGSVQIAGLVSRPGFVEWRQDLKLRDLLVDDRGFRFAPLESLVVVEEPSQTDGRPQLDVFLGSELAATPPLLDRGVAVDAVVTVLPSQQDSRFDREQFFSDLVKRLQMAAPIGSISQTAAISGAVRIPGVYPLTRDRSVADLIKMAGGFMPTAELESLELINFTPSGYVTQNIAQADFVATGRITGRAELIVREARVLRTWPQVTVTGRVRFPGSYRVEEGSTVRDLIERAGGLLNDADLTAAVFSREALRIKEQQQLRMIQAETEEMLAQQAIRNRSLTDGGNVDEVQSAAELARLLRATEGMETAGRLVIDLPGILAGRVDQNIRLENGDVLVVPGLQQSVTIMGEVLVPTSHVHQLGLEPKDYLRLSGGLNARSDLSRAYVVRANGAVQPLSEGNFLTRRIETALSVQPGDTIIVPRKVDDISSLQLWTSVTQILYQSAIAIAAIGAL